MKPTTYKVINEFLQHLVLQTQAILENNLLGAYIGGSLATDSFNPETSDIDYYVITTSLLSENKTCKLEKMHKQIYSSNLKYAKKLEASYIPQQDLLNFSSGGTRPYFNEGNFYPLAPYGNNYLIELHVLREKGATLLGPEIKNLIKEVSTPDLMSAIQKNLQEYWNVTLKDTSKYERNDYQVFSVLTMCRTLYSLKTGCITSKTEAALWATPRLESRWQKLIKQILAWKFGQDINLSKGTREFVKYVLQNADELISSKL